MEPFIDDHVLTPYDIADVAYYLTALPIGPNNGKGPGTGMVRGKQLYDKDCADCHGAKGEGDAVKYFPMVAAQHYKYLLREVNFIRDGDRRNSNPDMVNAIKPYTSSDLEAVSDYMAALPSPKK
jgi:cytochrome c553